MDEIKPAVAWIKAQKRSLGAPHGKPAGWIIVDETTGKRIGSDTRHPSREEAEAHIDAAVAGLKDRRRIAQERDAATQAVREDAITVESITTPTAAQRRYRTVHNGTYGVGRVYYDEPGCTYYDDGSGRFRIQIWDS